MKKFKKLIFMSKMFVVVLFFNVIIQPMFADGLVVVAGENFSVNTLTKEEIRSIYVAKKFHVGGQKVIPINLGIDNPLRLKFESEVVNVDRDRLSRIWLQAHFLGYKTPKTFKTQEMVAEFLSKVDSSIGYLDESMAQKYHLKILFRERK
jgi:hypothetical protein